MDNKLQEMMDDAKKIYAENNLTEMPGGDGGVGYRSIINSIKKEIELFEKQKVKTVGQMQHMVEFLHKKADDLDSIY